MACHLKENVTTTKICPGRHYLFESWSSVGHLASSLFLLYIKRNFHETKCNKRHGEWHVHECLLLAENRGRKLRGERKGSRLRKEKRTQEAKYQE